MLGAYVRRKQRQSGRIPAGMSKAWDQPACKRIAGPGHDDGNSCGSLLGGPNCRRCERNNDVDIQLDQFLSQRCEASVFTVGVARLDHKILSFRVSEFLHSQSEITNEISIRCGTW